MVKYKALPIILAASFLLGAQPVRANTGSEFTPVLPKASGYPGNTDETGLEKYEPEDSVYTRVIREDDFFDANGISGYLNLVEDEDDVVDGQSSLGAIEDRGNISNGLVVKASQIDDIDEVSNIKVNGALPQVTNLNNSAFANRINENIRTSYLNLVNAGYRSIESSYDVYNWANMTSIVIRYNIGGERSAGGKEVVKTFVFDDISQNDVTLRNLLGKDYMALVNSHVSSEIKSNKNGFYYVGLNAFTSIKPSQSFYVKDGVIHIVFDEYSIAPGSSGTPEFTIPLESITFTLSRNEYEVKDGVTYIPVTALLRVGMTAELKSGGVMEITSFDKKEVNTIHVNNDNMDNADVIYINGYDIGISVDYAKTAFGVNIENQLNSSEIMVSYTF